MAFVDSSRASVTKDKLRHSIKQQHLRDPFNLHSLHIAIGLIYTI